MEHIVCKFCGEELKLRAGGWRHRGTGCGQEPEAVTAAGYVLSHPESILQSQGNFYTTCARCNDTALVDASKPVPHGHPTGWVEDVYDWERSCTYGWCCDLCAERLLGPALRLGPNGEVITRIVNSIDYVCPFCKAHVPDMICRQCGGIPAFAIFPLNDEERQALADGNSHIDPRILDRLTRRGILTPDKQQMTPLGLSLRLLFQSAQTASS